MNPQFECFIKNSPDAVAVIKESGILLLINSRFSTLLNIPVDRAVQTKIFDYHLPGRLKTDLEQAVKWVGETGREKSFNCESEDGSRNFSFFCRVIPYFNGSTRDTLIEIRDETRLVVLRKNLKEKKIISHRQETLIKERRRKLFFGLFEELPTFIYLQRRDYTVAFANKKVRKLYGESEGKLCYEVFAGRSSPCLICPTFEVFDTGQSVEWEFTDSNGRTFLIYDYPFEGEDGDPLVLEMGVDITDLKNVEKELSQAQRLRAIGVLAGGIAHDLNNNLVPIIFNIEYAKEKVDKSELSAPLEEALLAANRAASLVAQVLEYSRQQDVNRQTIYITPLIRSCISDFQMTAPDNISLQADWDIHSSCILANPTQMQQVIMNLLRNAEQSMPKGGSIHVTLKQKEISLKLERRVNNLAPGKYVVLKVRDTGKGIRPDILERIFDPFFTTKKSSGGIGMGLALVHSIILGSKGKIFVESTQGIGTVFTVFLPLSSEPQATLEGELCDLRGENIHLLLVDDDPGVLTAMERSLKQADFIVDTAGSGEHGLALFKKDPHRYSLVLADHAMPGMTGLEMAEQMLALQKGIKIVICTGHIEPALEEQAKKKGVSGFARKPMSPKKMTELVRQHCR